jgi:hypothetical protein
MAPYWDEYLCLLARENRAPHPLTPWRARGPGAALYLGVQIGSGLLLLAGLVVIALR